MTAMDYVIWRHKPEPDACVLKDLRGLDQTFRLNDGTPIGAAFPAGVAFHMDPEFPNDLGLVDSLMNIDSVLVVSQALDAFLRQRAPAAIEHHPVQVIDHKGRAVDAAYFIAHSIDPVDCLDRTHSVFKAGLINPKRLTGLKQLRIDPSKVPADRSLFRVKGIWELTLVRRDLADAIVQGGYTGVRFLELTAFPE